MLHRLVRVVSPGLLGLLASLGVLTGCGESTGPNRIVTTLGPDGYALFRVDGAGAERVAVIVEMRDAPPGTYVLLHSESAPQSTGWFSLDTSALTPCREYGADAAEHAELDCLVADGRGELVDMIAIADDKILLPPVDGGAPAHGSRTTLMRHEMCACEGCQCSSASASSSSSSSSSTKKSAQSDYYAVMRVEGGLIGRDANAIPFAIEVRPFGDADDGADPVVTQVQ